MSKRGACYVQIAQLRKGVFIYLVDFFARQTVFIVPTFDLYYNSMVACNRYLCQSITKQYIILFINKNQTFLSVCFPQYFVVVLARRQPSGVLRLVLRKPSSIIIVFFLLKTSIRQKAPLYKESFFMYAHISSVFLSLAPVFRILRQSSVGWDDFRFVFR